MTVKSSVYSWLPPTYDLSTKPELRYTFAVDDERDNENFARNVRWYGYLANDRYVNLQGLKDSRRFHVYGSLRKQNTRIIFHLVCPASSLLSQKVTPIPAQPRSYQVSLLSFFFYSLTVLAYQHDQTWSCNNQPLYLISLGFRPPRPMTPRHFAF